MIANPYFVAAVACTAILIALAASGAVIALFGSLKKEIGLLGHDASTANALAEKITEIQKQVEQIRSQVAELEQRRSPAADWSAEPASVNLNRRGQVLRLHRKGEPSSQIASALGMSQAEVRLIVKVHELTRPSPETEKSGERFSNNPGNFRYRYTGPQIGGGRT